MIISEKRKEKVLKYKKEMKDKVSWQWIKKLKNYKRNI